LRLLPPQAPAGPPTSPTIPPLLNATRDSISTDSSASFKCIVAVAMTSAAILSFFGASKALPVAPDPFGDLDDVDKVPTDPRTASQLEALIEKTRDEVLAYHFAGRPANTTKNYAPKQREWSVSLPLPSFPKHVSLTPDA
jgi:hypothetical protein